MIYTPIMQAKQGEFMALEHLAENTKNRMMPVFEVPNSKTSKKPLETRLGKIAVDTRKVWEGREAWLDISKWAPNTQTESGAHVLASAFSKLRQQNVIVHPVVGYDRIDDPIYMQALKGIRQQYAIKVCLRLDSEAFEDMGDSAYFADRIRSIMDELEIAPRNCVILADFADVTKDAIADILETAEVVIRNVQWLGFGRIILAGSSMPASINEAVEGHDSIGYVPRKEMMAWKGIINERRDANIIFGDYVVRNPNPADNIFSKHANAKIRYSVQNQYLIARGHSRDKTGLAEQNKKLAMKIVSSPEFCGAGFSWGDSEIMTRSIPGSKDVGWSTGWSTGWVAVDSNHHIQTIVLEILEHQMQVIHGRVTQQNFDDLL